MTKEKNDHFSEKEAQERFDAALRGALKTPHEPLKEKPKLREQAKKKPGKKPRAKQ